VGEIGGEGGEGGGEVRVAVWGWGGGGVVAGGMAP
jgi:hypothetical protein